MILLTTALLCFGAVLFDYICSELPDKWHPIVWFGSLCHYVEITLIEKKQLRQRTLGILAVVVLVVPLSILSTLLYLLPDVFRLSSLLLLVYLAIGARSLSEHALAVEHAIIAKDLIKARYLVSLIVSRNTSGLNHDQLIKATVESILENSCDAIFGALFWFTMAGGPGVLLYRLANTLDAMWGYRNQRYLHFGWAAAKLDDVLNWCPARLTAFGYIIMCKNHKLAWRCWKQQAHFWDSPNAGPIIATGAGALGIPLGGSAEYEGVLTCRPILGDKITGNLHSSDISRALNLMWRVLSLWLVVLLLLGVIDYASTWR